VLSSPEFLADASKLSSDARGKLSGAEKEIKSDLKLKADEANQQLEKAVSYRPYAGMTLARR